MLDQLLHQKRTHRRTKQYFEVAPNKLFSTLQVIASFLSCAMCLKHSCVTLISQVANCFWFRSLSHQIRLYLKISTMTFLTSRSVAANPTMKDWTDDLFGDKMHLFHLFLRNYHLQVNQLFSFKSSGGRFLIWVRDWYIDKWREWPSYLLKP